MKFNELELGLNMEPLQPAVRYALGDASIETAFLYIMFHYVKKRAA